ncbi:MAG: fatty acid desaturase [Pikeienuella sp.]
MSDTMQEQTERAFGRDLVIDRKTLKPYTKRTDRTALLHFLGHMGLIGATGTLTWMALGTLWVVPALLAHAVVLAFLFAPMHECSHGTPFRSRWLNETVYWIVCLIYIMPPTIFRYEHATHHTYTQIRGQDPDMMPERMTVWDYAVYLSGYVFWKRGLIWLFYHPFGYIRPEHRRFLPDSEVPRVIFEGRVILAIYGGIAAVAIGTGSLLPLWLWIVPRLVGEPLMRFFRIAEHAECEEGGDLRTNTRTTRTTRLVHFLHWNMSYHAEHHICPMVPYHALAKLHDEVGDKLHPIGESYPAVHSEVLSKISRHEGVTWNGARGQSGPVAAE